jgi:hypothetical protein
MERSLSVAGEQERRERIGDSMVAVKRVVRRVGLPLGGARGAQTELDAAGEVGD